MLVAGPCALCGADCRHLLCAGCDADLPRSVMACRMCALPVAAEPCPACVLDPPPWENCVAPFLFHHPLDRIIHAFKYHGRIHWARPLALEIVRRVRALARPLPQALVPIPVTATRLATRGFNQALELARTVGSELDIAVLTTCVRRLRAEAPQVGLAAEARRVNVRGAFGIAPCARMPGHVAVIDDLVTTGATVAAMTALLKQHGVTQVDVWAVARTPPPGGAGRR